MEFSTHIILLGAGLIALSIIVGNVSSRFGAPLLLVFLILGMLAGEDGPGGIEFDNFRTAYLVGSVALVIILFDGGLRTSRSDFRIALAPAGVLASVGVLVTALVTGGAASWILDIGWLEGLLVGSIVASTDAAAVFLLLHMKGLRLRDRVRSTLEVEAGLNDPMAVFLTVTCVSLLTMDADALSAASLEAFAVRLTVQALGGIVAGLVGGYLLLVMVNRLSVAPGLYPVLAVAGALLIFSVTDALGGSGFLAAYLAGFVFGSRRHRATLIINQFHDGLAWLSQIAMFLILGLLVTPSSLPSSLVPALAIAFVLIFVARPLAVMLCGVPLFGFGRQETAFVAWVGLRGAVPIFLGTFPVLAGIEGARTFFDVVFVVVLASLMVQGWTIGLAARRLGLVLPPRPEAPPRVDIDLPHEVGRDMAAYVVQPSSLALRRKLRRLPLPANTDIVSLIRDGAIRSPQEIEQLAPGDHVLLMAAAEHRAVLDRLFGRKDAQPKGAVASLGEFVFSGETATGAIADTYDFQVPERCRELPVGEFLGSNLFGRIVPGRRLRLGAVELVVREMKDGKIGLVAVELDTEDRPSHRLDPLVVWFRAGIGHRVREKVAALRRRWRARTWAGWRAARRAERPTAPEAAADRAADDDGARR